MQDLCLSPYLFQIKINTTFKNDISSMVNQETPSVTLCSPSLSRKLTKPQEGCVPIPTASMANTWTCEGAASEVGSSVARLLANCSSERHHRTPGWCPHTPPTLAWSEAFWVVRYRKRHSLVFPHKHPLSEYRDFRPVNMKTQVGAGQAIC